MFRHFTHMMELYVIEGYSESYPQQRGRELTDSLIRDCLEEYGISDVKIWRTEKGKPCVETENIYVSVSHSGDYFVCLAGDVPLGVDIQQERKVKMESVSRRYFSPAEIDYVKEHGQEGFFFIWTRKEAYSKFTGLGLEEVMKGTDVLNRDDVEFIDFQLERGMYCSCCIAKEFEKR